MTEETQDSETPSGAPNRKADVLGYGLNPADLRGSYFHRYEGGVLTNTGVVVAKISEGSVTDIGGVYLIQFEFGGRRAYVQRLFSLERMLTEEWAFFDTETDAALAYADYVAEHPEVT